MSLEENEEKMRSLCPNRVERRRKKKKRGRRERKKRRRARGESQKWRERGVSWVGYGLREKIGGVGEWGSRKNNNNNNKKQNQKVNNNNNNVIKFWGLQICPS